MFGDEPIPRLFAAILQQARLNGVDRVRFDFTDQLVVSFQRAAWEEAMRAPRNLSAPLEDLILKVEQEGFDSVRPLLRNCEALPEDIRISALGRIYEVELT